MLLGSARGELEAHKECLGEPNRRHRGCLETPLGSLGIAWEALGPAWETPRHHFEAENDPKLDDFASNVLAPSF